MTADEWWSGKNSGPKLINLEKGFVPCLRAREFSASTSLRQSATSLAHGRNSSNSLSIGGAGAPTHGSALGMTIDVLQRENTQLKSEIAAKDARIRELEAKLGGMKA